MRKKNCDLSRCLNRNNPQLTFYFKENQGSPIKHHEDRLPERNSEKIAQLTPVTNREQVKSRNKKERTSDLIRASRRRGDNNCAIPLVFSRLRQSAVLPCSEARTIRQQRTRHTALPITASASLSLSQPGKPCPNTTLPLLLLKMCFGSNLLCIQSSNCSAKKKFVSQI